MNRTQIVLSVTLILQIVLIFATRTHEAETAGLGEPRTLLPTLEKAEPAKIEISSKEGESLTLSKTSDAWSIDQAGGYPADGSKVKKLLDDLRGLKVRNPVVTGRRYHDALEVTDDKARARVRVWSDPKEDPVIDLLMGKSSGARATDVRLEGEDDVWEITGLAPYDVRPNANAWIDTKLVDTAADVVTSIRVENGNAMFAVAKDGEKWKVTEPENYASLALDGDKVDTLVRSVVNLSVADPIGKLDEGAQGLAAPAARVTITVGGETPRDVTLLLGGLTGENSSKRYVTRAGSGWTGTTWKSSTDRIVDATLDSLTDAGGGN